MSPIQNLALKKRIEITRASLCCFGYSLIGLVPLIGIPFSLAALAQIPKARKAAGSDWNPADRYLAAARRIAPLGFLTSIAFLVIIGLVIPALWRDATCSSGST